MRFRLFQRRTDFASGCIPTRTGPCRVDGTSDAADTLALHLNMEDNAMPIILWLLGVPLSLIIVLALLGVF